MPRATATAYFNKVGGGDKPLILAEKPIDLVKIFAEHAK